MASLREISIFLRVTEHIFNPPEALIKIASLSGFSVHLPRDSAFVIHVDLIGIQWKFSRKIIVQ
jgi:hypothetical protein